jgi:hypothetical protein
MYISKDAAPAIKRRHEVEVKIVKKTVADLIAAGYLLNVNDGGDELVLKEPSTDVKALHDALINTDEDFLLVYKAGEKKRFGWVRFVYGNDGWDVINDYTTNLDPVMEGINKYADKFS